MMVFDRFRSQKDAKFFLKNVEKKIGLNVKIFSSQEEFDEFLPLYYSLKAPIVAVGSYNERVNDFVQGVAKIYGGCLAVNTEEEEEEGEWNEE